MTESVSGSPASPGKHLLLVLADSPENEAAVCDAGSLGWETRDGKILAWFPADESVRPLLSLHGATLAEVPDEDWLARWREGLAPIETGIFRVRAPWMKAASPESKLLDIVIPPEMAFGTGHHATTRTALALLARAVRPAARVLDFGCGSGILAIAARKMGAGESVAADIDPQAVKSASGNAALNGVAVTILQAAEPPAGPFDLIVANIQSSILLPLMPAFEKALRPGGRIVLSGILAEEPEEAFGRVEARLVAEGWKSLLVAPK